MLHERGRVSTERQGQNETLRDERERDGYTRTCASVRVRGRVRGRVRVRGREARERKYMHVHM
jgi:hypothetical protein